MGREKPGGERMRMTRQHRVEVISGRESSIGWERGREREEIREAPNEPACALADGVWMTDMGPLPARRSARLSASPSATNRVRGWPPYCAATHPSAGAPLRGGKVWRGVSRPLLTGPVAAAGDEEPECRAKTNKLPSSAERTASPCLRTGGGE